MKLLLGGKTIELTPIEQQRVIEAMQRDRETIMLRDAICYLPKPERMRDAVQMTAESILKREA